MDGSFVLLVGECLKFLETCQMVALENKIRLEEYLELTCSKIVFLEGLLADGQEAAELQEECLEKIRRVRANHARMEALHRVSGL